MRREFQHWEKFYSNLTSARCFTSALIALEQRQYCFGLATFPEDERSSPCSTWSFMSRWERKMTNGVEPSHGTLAPTLRVASVAASWPRGRWEWRGTSVRANAGKGQSCIWIHVSLLITSSTWCPFCAWRRIQEEVPPLTPLPSSLPPVHLPPHLPSITW